jgi:hypothetical protein
MISGCAAIPLRRAAQAVAARDVQHKGRRASREGIVTKQKNYASVFALITREHPEALLVGGTSANYATRHLIIEFAAKNRLPAIYAFRDYVAAGDLTAYGTIIADILRRAARYVDRILKNLATCP